MQQAVQLLQKVMEQEKELYACLLARAIEKKDIITKNDVNALNEIVRFEDKAVSQVKELDQQKQAVLAEIQQEYQLDEMPDLSTIISLMDDIKLNHELDQLRQEILQIIVELSNLNELNQKLIETQLQYTSFCIELMTQEQSVGDFYGSTGLVHEGPQNVNRGLIDRKV